MPAIWPPPLPQGFLDGSNTETAENNLLRSEMDVGPPKVRRRTTAGAGMLEGIVFMTQAQHTLFLQFWRSTLRSGALAFQLATTLLRFKEPPSWTTVRTSVGMCYQVSMKLEVLP
jgi:hypothetical protein